MAQILLANKLALLEMWENLLALRCCTHSKAQRYMVWLFPYSGNNSSKEKDGIYCLKFKRKGWDTYMLEVEKLNLQP